MKDYLFRAIGMVAFVVGWLTCCCLSTAVVAQETTNDDEWKRGYHGFNLICSGLGLTHQSQQHWEETKPFETVLVVFGRPVKNLKIDAYLNRGGTVLYATDQDSNELRKFFIGFQNLDFKVHSEEEGFQRHADCPVITNLARSHPVVDGISRIVANRPGALVRLFHNRRMSEVQLAILPRMKGGYRDLLFMSAYENQVGGKLLCVADQSVFTNQMLVHGDNAVFSKQVVEWLRGEDRKFIHVVANGTTEYPTNLANLDVELPPPTRKEVVDALQELPPSMLVEFGNEVASIIEDEDMFNEFLTSISDRIRPKAMNRFLIFFFFSTFCVFAMIVFAKQRRFGQLSASGVANENARIQKKADKRQAFVERQMAVEALLDSFCLESSKRRYRTWTNFPSDLDVGGEFEASAGFDAMLKSMAKTNILYKSKSSKYWTRARLLQVEDEIDHWRAFYGIPPIKRSVIERNDER